MSIRSLETTGKIHVLPGKTPFLLVLVTPAHLQLLDAGDPFLPLLLTKAVTQPRPGQIFELVAAVVDRIPGTTEDVAKQDGIPQTVNDDVNNLREGYEGVSVAILDTNLVAPDLWSRRQESLEKETMTIQQRCSLSFAIPPSTYDMPTAEQHDHQNLVSRTIQLPVANTLFQNGRTSTLLAQRWTCRSNQDDEIQWDLDRSISLPQQTLHLDNLFAAKRNDPVYSFHSHLTPITHGRVITAAIGNIIRRIGTGSTNAEHLDNGVQDAREGEVPASTELETAINDGTSEGRIARQTAGVWALVRPCSTAMGLRPIVSGTGPERLQSAILSGCRLHKVLSGGGGWGEKQGLLALDPDSDYNPRQTFESSFESTQSAEAEKDEALGEVVKPGDEVVFYVCKEAEAVSSCRKPRQEDSHKVAATTTLAFGSLPSTMDAMPSFDVTDVDNTAENSCVLLNDHFGMLSEQGMSLTVPKFPFQMSHLTYIHL